VAAFVGFPRGRARRTWRPGNLTPTLTTQGRGTRKGSSKKGHDEAVKDMIMGKIQDAFTSIDPKMVELRMQMFH
jgi:hypothetical protein